MDLEKQLIELNKKLDYLISEKEKEIYTTDEAMDYLRVSRNYLLGQVDKGLIRHKLKGRDKLFKKKWLDDWVEGI